MTTAFVFTSVLFIGACCFMAFAIVPARLTNPASVRWGQFTFLAIGASRIDGIVNVIVDPKRHHIDAITLLFVVLVLVALVGLEFAMGKVIVQGHSG